MDARSRAYLWQPPRTHREPLAERRVSFLELFYDLVYVVLIARVAEGLHGTITLTAVGGFVTLFGLLWIGWWNGTVLLDAHGRPDLRNRALTFLQMFAIAVMALYAPTATGEGGAGFALAYVVFLGLLTWQWSVVLRTERHDPVYGPIARRYTIMMSVMTLWTAASVLAPAPVRLWMWAAFVAQFAIGMIATAFGFRSQGQTAEAMASESLRERYGLFVIIVLGEVVAGVVNGLGAVHHLTVTTFLTGFAGLAVGMALWWTYFDLISLRPPRPEPRARMLFSIVQLPLALAIAGVGGATVSLIEHTGEPDGPANWAFSGFVALAQVSIGVLAWLLRDREALMEMISPALIGAVVVVLAALVLPLVHPTGLTLATVLFVGMCFQWFFAVRGWWHTAEGVDKLASLPDGSARGAVEP